MMLLNQAIKLCVAFMLLGVLSIGWALLTEPAVQPNFPAESLFTVSETIEDAVGMETVDFVFRPLFAASRRPAMQVDLSTPDAGEISAARRIEGVSLIGVFSSDAAQGAILRRDTGEQFRLVEGNYFDGWQLRRVEARAAVFTTGSGANLIEERVEMGMISSLPTPQVVPTSVGDTAQKTEVPALTFDSVHKQRAARNAAQNTEKDNVE